MTQQQLAYLNELGQVADELNKLSNTALQHNPQSKQAQKLADICGTLRFATTTEDPKGTGYTLLVTALTIGPLLPNNTLPALSKVIGMLLKLGANTKAQNPEGKTVLLLVDEQLPDTVFGATQEQLKELNPYIQSLINLWETIINQSLIQKAQKTLEQLAVEKLTQKSDINAQSDQTKKTALHYAAQYNLPDIAFVLIKRGAKIDIMDNQGDTPLHTAVKHGSIDTIKQFINIPGLDITVKNKDGKTALDIATKIRTSFITGNVSTWIDIKEIKELLEMPTIQQELQAFGNALGALARSL